MPQIVARPGGRSLAEWLGAEAAERIGAEVAAGKVEGLWAPWRWRVATTGSRRWLVCSRSSP